MAWGGGGKNLTARIVPDMLGGKMGTKRVPVGALNAPTISKCTALRGEAVRDDGRSPKPLFGVETEEFRVYILADFWWIFWGAPNKRKTAMWCPGEMSGPGLTGQPGRKLYPGRVRPPGRVNGLSIYK